MDGGIVLPITVRDNASSKLDKIAKEGKKASKTLKDAFSKGFDMKLDKILGGDPLKKLAFNVGKEIMSNVGKGIKAGFDISNEMTPLMGKLRMAFDEGSSINEGLAKIEATAKKTRMPMETLTKSVADFGLTTGQYFNNDELIKFMGSISAYGSLIGANEVQVESAVYQLQQAFSKGRMQMDDLKPIMNAFPGIANDLAAALGVSVAELQEMTSAGEFTADKIKQAFLGIGDTVQARLDQMPMTLEQRMYGIQNATFAAKKAIGNLFQTIAESTTMQVVLGGIELTIKKLVSIFNGLSATLSKVFGKGKDEAKDLSKAIEVFANVALVLIGGLAIALLFCAGYFLVVGVQALFAGINAMTGGLLAQLGWWPVLLIFLAIIAVIALVIGILTYLNIGFADVAEVIGALLGGAIAFVINAFLALLDVALGIVNYLGRRFTTFANFFGNIFKDPIATIIYMFRDMVNTTLSLLKTLASAIDKLFGSHLADSVQGWMNGVDKLADKAVAKMGNGKYEGTEWRDLTSEDFGLKRASYGEWIKKGASVGRSFGEGVEELMNGITSLDNLFGEDVTGLGTQGEITDYDADSGKGSLSTKLDDDTIDELKAFAEIQYRLNYRHITPNVNIKFGDVRETADLDDITKYIKKMMDEDLEELYIMEG